MIHTVQLEYGCFYHIYNRGNNREIIFKEDSNYLYFLTLLKKYIIPVADIYSYCLLNNHFHLLIRTKESEEKRSGCEQSFSNLFNAYAKAFNKKYSRTGKLFEERFKRKKIDDEFYLTEIIYYIHGNPQKHGLLEDFRKYKYSSFNGILSDKPTALNRKEVLGWFGGISSYKDCHHDWYLKLKNEKIDDLNI